MWDLLPFFWDFNVWKCYIPKWLIIYCSPIIHKLREPTQNGVIQFMVTKRGQISKWIWVSKPQPTIGIWLCMSFRWKSQLHTLHRDLSFDAILRAFFVKKAFDLLQSGNCKLHVDFWFQCRRDLTEFVLWLSLPLFRLCLSKLFLCITCHVWRSKTFSKHSISVIKVWKKGSKI